MVQCPKCSNQIDQEFGMVTCQECQAVFMIDFSGNIEFSDGKSVLSEPIIDDEPLEDLSMEEAPIEEQGPDIEHPSYVGESPLEDNYMTEEPEYITANEQVEELEPEDSSGKAEYQEMDSLMATPAGGSEEEFEYEEIHEEEAVSPPQRIAVPDNEPVDVTEFANSEDSLLEDGLYLYNLFIDRIDSKELRETVKYVLGDDKLKLDYQGVMTTLKNGRLVIPDLHPLKAKRIIEQLQYFDFDIRWEQHLVVLEDEATEMDIDVDL